MPSSNTISFVTVIMACLQRFKSARAVEKMSTGARMRVSDGGIWGRFEAQIMAEPISKMVSVGGRGARGLICTDGFVKVKDDVSDMRSSDASPLDEGTISLEDDAFRDECKGEEALGGEEALVVVEGEEALTDGAEACGIPAPGP